MTETMLSDSTTALVVTYLYYLLLTSHICLFVDLSPLQKHPASGLNHFIASAFSALIPSVITNTMSFSSTSTETLAGVSAAIIASTAIILVIQRVIKIG